MTLPAADDWATITCSDCGSLFMVHISDLSKLEDTLCSDCRSDREEQRDREALDRSEA